MSNNENIKKKVGINIQLKLLGITCLLLFTFFLFNAIPFFISNFERGFEKSGVMYIIICLVMTLVMVFFAFGMPYFLLKLYPTIYYYEDGFSFGKNGEKIFYKKTDYFFIPHYSYPKQFLAIWYKNNDDTWKSQATPGYPKKGFELFQKDFVKVNYPKVIEEIKNGGAVEFLFNSPKKMKLGFNRKKYIEKKLKESMKIKVTRESITFDNEVYEWDKYKITTVLGTIVVKDENNQKILSLGNKALIHKINLLEVIISELGRD